MPHLTLEELDKRISITEQKIAAMGKIEEQNYLRLEKSIQTLNAEMQQRFDKMYKTMYENGVTQRLHEVEAFKTEMERANVKENVSTLWSWRGDVHKLFIAILTALIITWVTTYWFSQPSEDLKTLKNELTAIKKELSK